MFDVAFIEIINFLRQATSAVMGAAGLHGWIFYNRGDGELARLLERLMAVSAVLFVVVWGIGLVLQVPTALGHVGISLEPTMTEFVRSYGLQFPLVLVVIGLLLTTKRGLKRAPNIYHLFYFLMASLLISTYAVSDAIDLREVSYVLHGWHSIITLGTVVVLDYLFFMCRDSSKKLALLSKSFSRITLFIFIGLALDLLSTYFILPEALVQNDRFFFMQTVIVVLMINGVVLAGPLTRRASSYLSRRKELPRRLHLPLGLLGVISIVSWTTNTFLDFVPGISLTYPQLLLGYLLIIAGGFVVHLVVDGWPLGTKRLFW